MNDDDTGDATVGTETGEADTGKVDKDARITELQRQLRQQTIERASFETSVPLDILAIGETPEDIERIAGDALLWKATTAPLPPPPQTGAVSASWAGADGVGALGPADRLNPRYQQVQTRDNLSRMSPAAILEAWRAGHLQQIGVGAPRPYGSTPLTRR